MYTGKCRILKRMIRRPQDRCGGTFGPRCHCLVICHPCVIPLMAISCSTAGTSITFQVIQIALMNGCSFCTINVESKGKHHDVNNDVKIIMKFYLKGTTFGTTGISTLFILIIVSSLSVQIFINSYKLYFKKLAIYLMKIMLKIIYRICFATKYYFFFEIQPRRLFNFSWILYYFIFTLARC